MKGRPLAKALQVSKTEIDTRVNGRTSRSMAVARISSQMETHTEEHITMAILKEKAFIDGLTEIIMKVILKTD